MPLKTPKTVQRSFAPDSDITEYRVPHLKAGRKKGQNPRARTNFWPGKRLNYDFLERCKELVCRIPHPTGYYKHRGVEYRLTTMDWGRGSYIDIRQYQKGRATPVGILLHIDIAAALMPELVATIRRQELADTREPDKKATIKVLYGNEPTSEPGE